MTVKVTLLGTKELANKLKAIRQATKEGAVEFVNVLALDAQREAKRMCPVAKVHGGTLRNSIYAKFSNPLDRIPASEVGSEIPYAPFVEFGTVNMSAQPYLRPGVDKAVELAEKRAQEKVGRAIERVVQSQGNVVERSAS